MDDEDREILRRLHASADRDKAKTRERMQQLIATHPALSLSAFALPSDLDMLDLFSAGEAMRLLYLRVMEREGLGQIMLGRWGQLWTPEKELVVPTSTVMAHVLLCLEWPKDRQGLVLNMVQWTFEALRRSPTLLRGFSSEAKQTLNDRAIGWIIRLTRLPDEAPQGG